MFLVIYVVVLEYLFVASIRAEPYNSGRENVLYKKNEHIVDMVNPSSESRENVAEKLIQILPATRLELLRIVSKAAEAQGCVLYLVGGFVRDLMLDVIGTDFDLVVEGDAIALGTSLSDEHGGQVASHPRFGTAKWWLPTELAATNGVPTLDLVTARTEVYNQPSELPIVEMSSIKLDLRRRDFTINTLAICISGDGFGDLYDYCGGLHDLEMKRVRVLHSLSFRDDPTRVLRAVRLEQCLGFELDQNTARLIDSSLPLLGRVSGDRIRRELEFILGEARPELILDRLDDMGVLSSIHPSLAYRIDTELGQSYQRARSIESGVRLIEIYFGLWLVRLSSIDLSLACGRLNMPRRLVRILKEASALMPLMADVGHAVIPSALAALLDGNTQTSLQIMQSGAPNEAVRDRVKCYLDELQQVTTVVTGDDLRRQGLKPGPYFGEVLTRLRNAWLDGEISSSEEENALLKKLLADKH